MGEQSRARRAARQRKRQLADGIRRTESRSLPPPPDPLELTIQAVRIAQQQRAGGVPAAQCVPPLLTVPDAILDKAVELRD